MAFWYNLGMTNDHVAKTVAVYDQIAHTYAANIEEYYSSIDRDAFLALVPNGGKILDAGCAAGRDSRYFDSKGYTVVGVDLSNKLLEIAKKQSSHIEFHIQDIRSLQFSKETFHGIYATAILLHLNRDEVLPVLRQFYTLLKPRGIVCIQVKEGAGEADVQEKLSEAKFRHCQYQVEMSAFSPSRNVRFSYNLVTNITAVVSRDGLGLVFFPPVPSFRQPRY